MRYRPTGHLSTLPMSSPAPQSLQVAIPILAVERETGLSKDTLRVWEKRYGFPRPLRNAADDRLYPPEQVRRLKLIKRLMDGGYRPGKIAALEEEKLQELLGQTTILSKTKTESPPYLENIEPMLSAITAHDGAALREALLHAQMRLGLGRFVLQVIAPLTRTVGDLWAAGRFEIFEEHLYTEVVSNVLRTCLSTLGNSGLKQKPKVLLTTIPQEAHGLGLLMVESLLMLEGCQCVSLGTQTPISDIVRAAQAHKADVVALSFSNLNTPASVQSSLRTLRSELPVETSLWVGGSCAILYQKSWEGVTALKELSGIGALVGHWREAHLQ